MEECRFKLGEGANLGTVKKEITKCADFNLAKSANFGTVNKKRLKNEGNIPFSTSQ